MKHLKRIIPALLLAALLLGLLPAGAASPEPDYTAADAVFTQLYRSISGRRAPMDDTARADRVEALLAEAESVIPGSVRRSGDELTWETEGGVSCRFSPYLYALMTGSAGAGPRSPEPLRKATASGRDICVFAPYSGLDDDFEGAGGSYDTWSRILARFTGGSCLRYEQNYATIDRLAQAVQSAAVVIIDSHGETDNQSRTSYLCLHSGEGITSADYAYDYRAGVCHAVYAGRGPGGSAYYEIDGTVISNHMTADAGGCLFWNATCYGMATRGVCDPLMARGAGAVYGYSRDVSFGGDRCWMETVMDELTSGATLGESIAAAKKRWGQWDLSPEICAANGWPGWDNRTLEQALRNRVAFPVVVSAQDSYPSNPNAPQTVGSGWRLPQLELYLRLHLPDGVKCPDVRGHMFYEGRLPTPTGIPRDRSRDYRFAGWSLEPFGAAVQPPALYAPGTYFSFGYSDGGPLSFGAQSADLYAVYSYTENGRTWYTSQVPDGPYDPYDPSSLFSDVAYGLWYYDNVRYAVEQGLVNGYNDGTFRPEATIRRSEVVTILYRAAGSPAPEGSAVFPDVPSGEWFAPAVSWAAEQGIVLGYNDGLFHPERPVTRAQLAVLFCRCAGADLGGRDALNAFPDRQDVPDWAEYEMAWAVEQGLINGSRVGGQIRLQPLNQATRAQFVAILQRYLQPDDQSNQ